LWCPHYHACLFSLDFADREFFKRTPSGSSLYISKTLQSLWPLGFSTVGDVTFESSAYVARYIMKKVNGDAADQHYSRFHSLTGELHQLKPEYVTMSRRPGLAKGWYDKFKGDVYPSDFLVHNGVKFKPPLLIYLSLLVRNVLS
jgi:hypothetical protein